MPGAMQGSYAVSAPPFLSFLCSLSFSGLLSNKSLSLLSWLVVALSFFFIIPLQLAQVHQLTCHFGRLSLHDPINNYGVALLYWPVMDILVRLSPL